MFFLPLAVVVWVASYWVIDWRRARTLLPYAVFGMLVALAEDQLGYSRGWWAYRDSGPFASHSAISALIAVSAAPLFAMAFAQKLRPGGGPPWLRVTVYTAVSMLPELWADKTGHIAYRSGWGVWWSVFAYLPTWLGVWALHRWITSRRQVR